MAEPSFLVLAGSYCADLNACAGLRDTCELFSVPLRIIGQDKPLGYPSNDPRLFLETAPDTLAVLRESDAEYVVITDSHDVLACRRWNGEEVARIIERSAGKLLVSCEANCFPEGPWRAMYDDISDSPWRYLNAGQYCGTRAVVTAFIETVLARVVALPIDPFGGAAQEVAHRLVMEGYPMGLDTQCRVFQSMYTGAAAHVRATEIGARAPLVRNWQTYEDPFFLHWNGRAPGMPEWYKSLTGNKLPISSMRPEYA